MVWRADRPLPPNDRPNDRGQRADRKPNDYIQRRIPEKEFKAMEKFSTAIAGSSQQNCRFWNSSIGCDKPDGSCPFAHNLCILCGGNHKWISCPKKK